MGCHFSLSYGISQSFAYSHELIDVKCVVGELGMMGAQSRVLTLCVCVCVRVCVHNASNEQC